MRAPRSFSLCFGLCFLLFAFDSFDFAILLAGLTVAEARSIMEAASLEGLGGPTGFLLTRQFGESGDLGR